MNSKTLLDWKEKLDAAASSQLIAAETVSEADIDITMGLLINSDREFRAWLISTLFKDGAGEHGHHQARWGVWTQCGESDLVWFVVIGDERKAILIENKINAGPQPKQYERYCERVEVWKKAGLIDDALIVLVSPAAYQSSEADSYFRLNYEVILKWIDDVPGIGARKELARLLTLGINKPQQGWAWTIRTDEQVIDWYQWLWTLQGNQYPNLWIIGKCPTGKNGKVAAWHTFSFSRGTQKYWMNLKLGERNNDGGGWGSTTVYSAVDLEIKRTAERIDSLRPGLISMVPDSSFKIIKAGKSIAIRKDVPLVRKSDYNETAALQVLSAAQEIQDWFEKNENRIEILLGSV